VSLALYLHFSIAHRDLVGPLLGYLGVAVILWCRRDLPENDRAMRRRLRNGAIFCAVAATIVLILGIKS